RWSRTLQATETADRLAPARRARSQRTTPRSPHWFGALHAHARGPPRARVRGSRARVCGGYARGRARHARHWWVEQERGAFDSARITGREAPPLALATSFARNAIRRPRKARSSPPGHGL